MNLIDDKGRLFGTINIIDALVVLLVLAVVAAGTAFVLQSDNQSTPEPESNAITQNATVENATRYATLNLGSHPSYVAEQITEGDNSTDPDADLTITDVYRIPTNKGVDVWTRVKLDGQVVERENTTEFTFAGTEPRPGSSLAIPTDEYTVNGTVRDRSKRDPSLPGGTTAVVLRTTTSADKATAIQRGDTYAVASATVATVESVAVYPTADAGQKRVELGLTLDTLARDGNRSFLGTPVQVGQQIPFRTDAYRLSGAIVHRGATTMPGERATTTATIQLSGLSPDIADGIVAGMTERGRDDARARITDVRVENTTVVVESDDGNVHEREHPTKRDVYLTVELDTRRTDAGLYFRGTQLQEGNRLVLDLGSITVRGQVTDLQQDD